jgi:hypothetical protein
MALNFNKEAEYTLVDDSVLLRPLQLTDAPNL